MSLNQTCVVYIFTLFLLLEICQIKKNILLSDFVIYIFWISFTSLGSLDYILKDIKMVNFSAATIKA